MVRGALNGPVVSAGAYAHAPLLAVVLSKAFLLADDARVTDPSIVRQLPPLP